MALDTPLSHKRSNLLYNIDDNTSLPSSGIQVISTKLNFSIGPGLVTRWLSYFKVLESFTTIIFYYVGQTPADVQWRNREKWNDKDHHEKVSSFSPSWVLEWFFCFVFAKNVFLRSIRQEVFYKKGVLRNFARITGKHRARVSFLIKLQAACNFIRKETLAQVFSYEICEISKNIFSYRTPPVAASTSSLPMKFVMFICSCRKMLELT